MPPQIPDYIPAEERDMYNFFLENEDFEALQEFDVKYKPQVSQPPATEPEARDPFAPSFMDTPQERAELKATEDIRMAQPLDTGTPVQPPIVPLTPTATAQNIQALQTIEAQQDKEATAPNEFYRRILASSVYDPALEPALTRSHERLTKDFDREQAKLFNQLTEQNIQTGQDLFQAQQNAFTTITGIIGADRIQQGFLAPRVKTGEGGIPDLRVTAPEGDELGVLDAFGRRTFTTEAQAEAARKRKEEAERLRSSMFASFLQQARSDLNEDDYDTTGDFTTAISDRAKQLESQYVQGELLSSIAQQVLDGYRQANNLPANHTFTQQEREDLAQATDYFYNNYTTNIYPEYAGEAPEEMPAFLKEVLIEERETGEVVETRTGQALRGAVGLFRPVSELVTDVMTYPVYENPNGTFTYPEGTDNFLQQPLITTPEREQLGYWGRVAADINDTRTLQDDFMAMPQLTKEIGDEAAGILGMGIEVMMPVTPIGLLAPTAKVAATGAKAVPRIARGVESLAKADGKIASLARSTAKTSDAAINYVEQSVVPVLEDVVGSAGRGYQNYKTNQARRQLSFDASDIDMASETLSKQLNDLIAKGEDVTAVERIMMEELEMQIDSLAFLPRGKKINFADMDELVDVETLALLARAKTGDVGAVANDIVQAQRLLQRMATEGASIDDLSTGIGKRIYASLYRAKAFGIADEIISDDFFQLVNQIQKGELSQSAVDAANRTLRNQQVLNYVSKDLTRSYLNDFLFNMTPENFVFISPRMAVSVPAYKKFGQEANEATANFMKDGVSFTPARDSIALKLDQEEGLTTLVEYVKAVDEAYGVAPSEVVTALKRKILSMEENVGSTIQLTQEEFNLLHGAVKEKAFFELVAENKGINAKKYMTLLPRRATQEAVERADVPLIRRNEMARAIRSFGRDFFRYKNPKLNYSQASQYGMVRTLQDVESEFSNIPQQMSVYARRTLDDNNGNTTLAFQQMIKEQGLVQGLETDFDILATLMRDAFDMTGISDDVFEAFVRSRLKEGELIPDAFNRMYDDFIKVYPSKEVTALGGKFLEKKQTALNMIVFIAEGMKANTTNKVIRKMENLYPQMFIHKTLTAEERALVKEGIDVEKTARAQALDKRLAEIDEEFRLIEDDNKFEIGRVQQEAEIELERLAKAHKTALDNLTEAKKNTNELYKRLATEMRAERLAEVKKVSGKANKDAVKAQYTTKLNELEAERVATNTTTDEMILSEKEAAKKQAESLKALRDGDVQKYREAIGRAREIVAGTRARAKFPQREAIREEIQRLSGEVREASVIRRDIAAPIIEQEILNTQRKVATEIYKLLSNDIIEVMQDTQIRYMNSLLSDLYEGKIADFGIRVEGGVPTYSYFLGSQGNALTSTAIRSMLTKGRIKQVVRTLNGIPEEQLRLLVRDIEVDPRLITELNLSPEEVLASKFIIQMVDMNQIQIMEKLMGFNPNTFIASLENVGFPAIKTLDTYEGIRPLISNFNGKGVIALPEDIAIINRLKRANIEGTLGQTFEALSRKDMNLAQYALGSIGYAVIAANQATKGGMLGGVFAPTGKYISVNAITAPFIMAYTTPQVASGTIVRTILGGLAGGAVGGVAGATIGMSAEPIIRLLRAYVKTAGQSSPLVNGMINALAGGSVAFFAGAPVLGGALAGGGLGVGAKYLGDILEATIRKQGGTGFIGSKLGMLDPQAKALTTIDGRVITAGEFQDMLSRNNILFSQVNFEFGQRALDNITRNLETSATGTKVNPVRQALRWLRPDRPNYWNTIAQETDNAFRMQVFHDSLLLGYTEKEAAELARRSLLDYSDVSEIEQRYIAQYFLFYSFARQSFFEVAGAIGRDPAAISNIVKAAKYGVLQKKLMGTDALFNDTTMKEKALSALWTKLGTSYDETMTLHYGAAFPSTESFIQIANNSFLIYDALGDYDVEGGVENHLIETFVVKGNPFVRIMFEQQSKKFRSQNAPHGVMPVREVIAHKSMGSFDLLAPFFDLEPIPPEEMIIGNPTYPETGKEENVQYRFASKDGRLKYAAWKAGIIAMGLDRGVQDWASTTAEKLELEGARLKRYTDGNMYLEAAGLSTPIMVPNHIVEKDKVMRQIKKELSAEMD
jgi:hypothetical protein